MEPTCTCGATLPPDAQFCPRCGRPLTAPLEPSQPEPVAIHDLSPQAPPRAPVGFGNPDAVRAAYPGAMLAALLANLPIVSLLCFIWYPAAGFFSVYRYSRHTRQSATPAEGAKLGWITGLFSFLISFVLLAVGILFISDGGLTEALEQSLQSAPVQEEMRRQLSDLLRNPAMVAIMLLVGLFFTFLVAVGLTTIGGALGAKVLEKD